MELLAPAGNTTNFLAAMDSGADAVYVGAPAMNARNLARDLSMEEIFAMVDYCHNHDKKIYLAANSLLREQDLSQTIETLALLESFATDGLIVQDLGLVRLIRTYFPDIVLHASTLLAANNSMTMHGLASLGFERVVLARELTLKEIETISKNTDLEIEVFVHGAMCFSYSGLCLFSSFLGGKSGLRGKCVQPCRRQYKYGEKKNTKGKYLFSMNDLSALEAVPELKRIGVSSLKIEGRLRTENYVSHIVQAYRLLMDVPSTEFPKALVEAEKLVSYAMGRSTSSGYFFSPQPKEAITAYHSGNMGEYLGRLGAPKAYKGILFSKLGLRESLATGDRIRLHAEPSGERIAFTVKTMRCENLPVTKGEKQDRVQLQVPEWEFLYRSKHIDVYKVDVSSTSTSNANILLDPKSCRKAVQSRTSTHRNRIAEILDEVVKPLSSEELPGTMHRKQKNGGKVQLDIWLRLDSAQTLLHKLPFSVDRFLLLISKENLALSGKLKTYFGRRMRDLTWCLPPIVYESEQNQLGKQLRTLIRSGFRSFQLGHISQFTYFGKERVFLAADYTVNILNSQTIQLLEEGGVEFAQLSVESDRTILAELVARLKKSPGQIKVGLTVYGAPALFTARLAPSHFTYNKTVQSPKQEQFTLLKKNNVTLTVPVRPFSLLPYLQDLQRIGLDYAVIDMSNVACGKKQLLELAERIHDTGRFTKLPTFNYLGELE